GVGWGRGVGGGGGGGGPGGRSSGGARAGAGGARGSAPPVIRAILASPCDRPCDDRQVMVGQDHTVARANAAGLRAERADPERKAVRPGLWRGCVSAIRRCWAAWRAAPRTNAAAYIPEARPRVVRPPTIWSHTPALHAAP